MTDRARGLDSVAESSGETARREAAAGRHRRDEHGAVYHSASRNGSRRDQQPAPPEPAERHLPARAAWWIFANAVSARAGTVVVGLVVARLVSPREFGAVAVAIVALLAVRSLDQLGAGRAIEMGRRPG